MDALSIFQDSGRVEAMLEQRAVQLALLNDIGEKIAAVLELDSVLDRAACLVQESFGYHHVGLFALDREMGELVMKARAGSYVHLFSLDHRLKLGQGIVGWVGRHGQTLLANDVSAEPRYVNLYPDVVPTQSELSVPIRVGQEVVGVLDAQSPQLDAFDESDVMVLETLADQIAVAIENARLYEAVQQELTERKRAEEALRRERDFSQSVIEATPALVVVLDTEGCITLFNRACEKLTGYTAAEAIGRTIWKFLIPERFVPDVQQVFVRLRADVLPSNYENPWLTQDGDERWISWTNTNVKDDAGDVVAIVGVGVDVTELRQTQRTLERRNRELQALVEAGQLLSGTLDLDEVLDRLLDVVQKQFDMASVSCSSYDSATQILEIRAQRYDTPAHQVGRIGERRQRDQHPYSSRALDTGQLIYEPDLWNAPHIPEERQAEAQRLNIRSVVEVPLIAQGQPVGVLHMRSFGVPRFFTDEELAFARAIAPGAAAAIDNAQLYGQIDAARARAEKLAARVVQAQEEERRRIARELHDEVGQLLTGAKLSQEMLVTDLPAELAELRGRALENVNLIDETMDVVRRLSLDLRPAALDELGLSAALEWHIERYQHQTGIQVTFHETSLPRQLPDPQATAVYRIVQEALTNVARHASARSAVVEVVCDDQSLRVQVTDDGCGFDAATILRTGPAAGHFGLLGLQERATLLGGQAHVESSPGQGTRITVELPLPEYESGRDLRGLQIRAPQKVVSGTLLAFQAKHTAPTSEV
jgi:PAS domain S-box-containing protein